MYRADPDGNIAFMNRSGLEALDVSEEEVLGQPFIPNIHPDDVESGLGVFQRILTEGTAVHNFECRFMTRRGRGREIPVLTNVTPLYDESGRIIGTQGIALDITEKKHMEDVLHEREVQLRFILDQLPITLWTTDRDLRFTSSLGAALPSLGLEPNQVVGMRVAEFYEGHEGSDIALDAHRKALSGEQIWYEAQFGDLTFSAHLQPLFGRDGSIGGAVGFGFDITERKTIEESLRESREQLQLAMDAASLGMWDWDILHNRIMVSRKGADMLALDGKGGDDDWQYHIDPDRLPPVSEKLRAHLDGETPVFENEIIVRDRSDERRWIRETGKVITRTPEGAPLRMTGIINDETERIQVQENLRRANQKLNLLASVTRHDILNQTMTLSGMYELLADEIGGDSPQVMDYLRILREAIERIQNQISFTRDYQHIGAESPRWQRVERVLGPAADHARASGLEVRIMADGLEIFSDPLLEKVFFNLADNTVRHGGGATTITVTFTEDTDGGILCVEDDGVGIPTPEKERVFERGVGKNTGFGLFLAREILGLGGIPLWETGGEGVGARFEMVVPRGQYRW
ncbi:MAG: PAS domain-containing sensor histidine kinase [Methanomicrobiales archaeon]